MNQGGTTKDFLSSLSGERFLFVNKGGTMKNWSFEELMARGSIENVVVKEDFLARLRAGDKLKIYQGFDPTSPHLHIGHMVGLRVLRWFQLHGHQVIFLIGDGTGLVGDPSGRSKKRDLLTSAIVKKNIVTYKKQVGNILDFTTKQNPAKVLRNSKWLLSMSLGDMLGLMSKITIQRLLERDMFQERLKKGDPLFYIETIYPLLQGYDAAMKVDAELGGSDQFFNMMIGRDLVRDYLRKDKFVLTTPLIPGLDGETMSKTRGNTVDLDAPPFEMFDKIMLLRDDMIVMYTKLLTDTPLDEIPQIEREVQRDPIAAKERLAFTIVSTLHDKEQAAAAQREFNRVRRKGEMPEEMPTVKLARAQFPASQLSAVDLLVATNPPMLSSRGEAKRMIEQLGVQFFDGAKIDKIDMRWAPEELDGKVIQIGKKRFFRVQIV
jgi:tyrosyl-tRNA synthetase